VLNATLVEDRVPSDEHGFAQIDIVAHHRVETWIGGPVLQAFIDIWSKLGVPQLLDIKHCDVRHGVFQSLWRGKNFRPDFRSIATTFFSKFSS
jgi:hypothetical protein